MQIPDEIQRKILALCDYATGTSRTGEMISDDVREWLDSQPQGEWVPVEGESTIKCGCDDDRCMAELHIDSLDGMEISIKDGDYTSTIYLPYDVRLCRKTEANRE